MRLKRLEMVGFKSFADKTRVEFEPGITAIVGPNGCGKSNIADSIRWALGEMSAKSLRSHQMMDVIFNGTANRAAQGMSEVSLTFDNSSGQLPIDYTEVTVSRRLFRSGESEYFINKTQCRLKDVRDLFLDTGVGNDGYYVMAQGKIEFILAAKPEERRELFEEAAGVSKYKVRREETLRRLAKVEQDMLRLNDSLAIYKQQMDALEAAVRKAKSHQKLQDELRRLEIAGLLAGLLQTQAAWEDADRQRQDSEGALGSLREAVSRREEALSQVREAAERLEGELLTLQDQMAQTDSDWAKTEAEQQAAAERTTELADLGVRLEGEARQLETDLAAWRKTHAALHAGIEELRGVYHAAHDRFKAEDARGRQAQEDLMGRQRQLESVKSRLLELARLISHHRNETVRLTSLSVRHDEMAKAKERELERLTARRDQLQEHKRQQDERTTVAAQRLQDVESRWQALEAQQAADRHAHRQVEDRLHTLRETLAALEAERVALERWLAQDPVAMGASAVAQAALPGIHGPVSALFKTSGPFQRLLDRALGDRAHFFIADTLNDAQAAIRHLSDARQGWATFLVLDRLLEVESSSSIMEAPGTRTLADVVECEERFRPVLRALLGRTYYLGETLFEETLIRGGADPDGSSYQATPTDWSRLNSSIDERKRDLEAAQTRRAELAAAIAARESERERLTAERQSLQVEAQVQRESSSRLQDDVEMIQTESRLLERECEDVRQAIIQTQEALGHEEVLLTKLEEEEKALQADVQARDADLQTLRHQVQEQLSAIGHLRVEAETLRERLLGREKEEENARGRVSMAETRLTQVQQERALTAERLLQLDALKAEKAAALAALANRREEQHRLRDERSCERQSLLARTHDDEEALAQDRQALEAAQRQAQESDFQVRTLAQEKIRITETLQAGFQLDPEAARAAYGEVAADAEELARIKRRLESMGPVNLAAPEEHAQLDERYQFLLTQQQDLLKAKEDLHQAIARINATTREHFKTTFEAVRTHFRSLYQQLFQGGEADLVLTDEHNLLESGIDIVAQPPGKKLQNIALLSGGEKALTAIALLFAFFLVKPSPFCLLDEVDAPLDEANVGRFVSMVRAFSEKTQFIVITHNKRTMEMADVLYGVTMAHLGISSLISVKLESTSRSSEPVPA